MSGQTREQLKAAAQLLQGGAVEKALAALSAIVAGEPDNADAFGLLGIALAHRNDFAGAADALRRALQLNPQHTGAQLNYGNVLKRLGRLEDAAESYRRTIALRPDGPSAHRQLAGVLLDLRRYEEAIEIYARLIDQAPKDEHARNDRGLAYLAAGEFDKALADFEAVLALNPKFSSAWSNRGAALLRFGQVGDALHSNRLADAIASFERALSIDANDWGALSGAGLAYTQVGNFAMAAQMLNGAAALRPDHPETYLDRARLAHAMGNNPAALFDLENVLRLAPAHVDALVLRAAINRELDKREEALADCDRALELAPTNWNLHNNRGVLLDELGRLDEAIHCFEKSLELNANNPDAFQNMGMALLMLKRDEEAVAKYDASLRQNPLNFDLHNLKGAVLMAMRRFNEAIDSFDRAIVLKPDLAISHFHRSFALLAQGRFLEGYEGYEWRRRGAAPFVPLPSFEQPELAPGEDVDGKRLLLYSEQGLGDVLQYSRFARAFADRGARVFFVAYHPLARLLASLGRDIQIIPPEGPAPEFDLTCPLMSAPYKLGTTLETIPDRTPYLTAAPDLASSWRSRLAPHPGPRVGLAWSGNPQYANDWMRSIAFAKFKALVENSHATFVVAQKDVRASDEEALRSTAVLDLRDQLHDFAETAALISELDLVVAVDTAIAHLAGALGKPVWILLPVVADWRWLEHRKDSPWYPTARLFRQSTIGDWDSVLAEVRAALDDLARRPKSAE